MWCTSGGRPAGHITTPAAGGTCLAELAAAAADRTNYVRLPTLVGAYRRRSVAA